MPISSEPPAVAVLRCGISPPDFPAGVKCEAGVRYLFPDPRVTVVINDGNIVFTTYGVSVVMLADDVVEVRVGGKRVYPVK